MKRTDILYSINVQDVQEVTQWGKMTLVDTKVEVKY
jgi:hypothetical protein